MALILCILIIVVILGKSSIDKASATSYEKEYKAKYQEQKERFERFKNKYEDRLLEDEIGTWFYKNDARINRMQDLIRSEVGVEPTRTMTIMAIMASKCKIPHRFIESGIGRPIWVSERKHTYTQQMKRLRDQLVFLKWYDKKLRENGMTDDSLICIEDGEKFGVKNKYPVSDMVGHDRGSTYCWHGNVDKCMCGFGGYWE